MSWERMGHMAQRELDRGGGGTSHVETQGLLCMHKIGTCRLSPPPHTLGKWEGQKHAHQGCLSPTPTASGIRPPPLARGTLNLAGMSHHFLVQQTA